MYISLSACHLSVSYWRVKTYSTMILSGGNSAVHPRLSSFKARPSDGAGSPTRRHVRPRDDNLTKTPNETVGRRTPIPLPTLSLFLLPPLARLLNHPLTLSLFITDAGVWERAQSMEHNPHKNRRARGRPTSEPPLPQDPLPFSQSGRAGRP